MAAVLRAWLGWNEVGIYWPDEIFQSLEPAHRLVFGNGLRAWELVDGARNWTFPALIAAFMKLAALITGGAPEGYLACLRLLFSTLGVLAAWGVYRLALVYDVKPVLAAAGAALFGMNAVSLYFSHRAMSEVASLAPVVWGFVLLVEARDRGAQARLIAGASLLGLATLIRLQNGWFCVGAIGLLVGNRRSRDAAVALGVLGAWALAFGAIDRITWGGWFHSAFVYLRFNVVEGKAAAWGTAPFDYYARVAASAMPGPALVLLATVPFSLRRAPAIGLTCLAFLVQLSLVPHKELRFVVPTLPLLFALSAIGADSLAKKWLTAGRVQLLALGLGAVALHSAFDARRLTFGRLGAYENEKPNASAWGDSESVNRLLLAAHRRPDLCGLKVEAVHLAWTGGQSYLHRRVNLYSHLGPPRSAGFYNHVVAFAGAAEDGEVVASHGGLALVRLPVASCVPDPDYSDRLP